MTSRMPERARTDPWEPQGSNPLGPPGPEPPYLRRAWVPVVALCLQRCGTPGVRRRVAYSDSGCQGEDHGDSQGCRLAPQVERGSFLCPLIYARRLRSIITYGVPGTPASATD